MKNVIFVQLLTWPQVFDIWRKNEADQEKWQKLYKEQGYNSWQKWRQQYIEPLGLDKLEWKLYNIDKPLKTIPDFLGGPFKKWQQHFYKQKNTLSFQELAQLPAIQQYQGIKKTVDNFPKQTTFIGLELNYKIYIVDGMHRCCALSMMPQINSEINIALAQYPDKELPIVGQ